MKQTFALTAILILLLTFFGCEEAVNYLDEYSGQNLIPADDFNSATWQPSTADPNYLVFAPVVFGGDTSALPWNTDISRLEIPNLALNGDFEQALTNWNVVTNTLTRFDSADATHGTYAIDDWSIYYNTQSDKSELVEFDLNTGLLDNFVDQGLYTFRFDYRGRYTSYFEVNDGSANSNYADTPWRQETNDITFPLTTFPDNVVGEAVIYDEGTVPAYFSLGTQKQSQQRSQTGYLDNFKVVKIDEDKWISLDVPLEAVGRSNLISGTYQFSIFVRYEETANLTPLTDNAFPAEGVSLRMVDTTPYPQGAGWTYYPADASWSDWKQITLTSEVNIESSVASGDIVFQLDLMPTNIGDQSPGRMLIAAPTLTLVP